MLLDHVLSGLKIKAKLLRYFFSRGKQLREKASQIYSIFANHKHVFMK